MKTGDSYHRANVGWKHSKCPNKWHPMQHLNLIILYV